MSPALFLLTQVLVVAFGVAFGAFVLWWVARRAARGGAPDGGGTSAAGRVGFGGMLRVGGWTIIGAGLCALSALPLGLRHWGGIRMVFLTGTVAIPAVGVLVVLARLLGRVRLSAGGWLLTAVGLALAPLGMHMTLVEPYRLQVERVDVTLAPERAGDSDVRVGVLADLQCNTVGPHEVAAVDALLAAQPDLIVVPGDIFQSHLDRRAEWAAVKKPLGDLLARVRAPFGVWFVLGDVDDSRTLDLIEERTDWHVLLDAVDTVRVRDREITIAGTTRAGAARMARAAEALPGTDDVRILVSHAPDTILTLEGDPRIDLFVAGHTHGGQVVVPGFGPPITLSRVPRAVARGGLHEWRGRAVYVSRGVGMERAQAPPMRLLSPPEVSVLTLRGARERQQADAD